MTAPSGLLPYGRTPTLANNTRDLGASTRRWRTAYIGTSIDVQADNATTNAVTRSLTLSHTTSGTAAAGIGAGVLFRAENAAGTLKSAGAVDAIHTTATNGSEVSALVFGAGIAGSVLEVARCVAVASAVNSLSLAASATGSPVAISARGSDTDVGLGFASKGAGQVMLVPGGSTVQLAVSTASGVLLRSTTDTGATPTASTATGIVRVPSGSTSVTVTNTLVSATSHVFAQIRNATSNAVSVLRCVPGSGTFDIVLSGNPGASHADISFLAINGL